jgi:uncharacterized repeat protein (TIGR03899 family)
MSKVQTLSGQQRLRQLARRQLGSDAQHPLSSATTTAKNLSNEIRTDSIVDQHARLSSRAGVNPTDPSIGYQSTLAERAQRRLQMKQEHQQHNLERVMQLAFEYCTDQVTAQEIDPDWFSHYCELVQNISTHSMQKLWAKILAGEIAQPGSFSLKTLNLLKQMSYKDAQALQQAAALSCRQKLQEPAHIYFGYLQQGSFWRWLTGKSRGMLNLSQFGLTYPQILNLADLGLLHQSEIESGQLSKNQQLQWFYHQQLLQGRAKHHGVVLQYYKFTAIGAELMPLLTSQPNPAYWHVLQTMMSDVITFVEV